MHYAIIAAGQGSRLAQEGITLPKPLVRLGGETMIERLVNIFARNGATAISVIVNEEMPEVKTHLESLSPGVPLTVISRTTPGSMHSFYELSRTIDADKFCLTTVDTVFRPNEFARFIEEFVADAGADGYMGVTTYIDDEKPLYVAVSPQGEITGFLDSPVEGVRFVSGGIYALKRNALEILSDCMASGLTRMRDFQRTLVAAGLHLKAFQFEKIVDVDHAADIKVAKQLSGCEDDRVDNSI